MQSEQSVEMNVLNQNQQEQQPQQQPLNLPVYQPFVFAPQQHPLYFQQAPPQQFPLQQQPAAIYFQKSPVELETESLLTEEEKAQLQQPQPTPLESAPFEHECASVIDDIEEPTEPVHIDRGKPSCCTTCNWPIWFLLLFTLASVSILSASLSDSVPLYNISYVPIEEEFQLNILLKYPGITVEQCILPTDIAFPDTLTLPDLFGDEDSNDDVEYYEKLQKFDSSGDGVWYDESPRDDHHKQHDDDTDDIMMKFTKCRAKDIQWDILTQGTQDTIDQAPHNLISTRQQLEYVKGGLVPSIINAFLMLGCAFYAAFRHWFAKSSSGADRLLFKVVLIFSLVALIFSSISMARAFHITNAFDNDLMSEPLRIFYHTPAESIADHGSYQNPMWVKDFSSGDDIKFDPELGSFRWGPAPGFALIASSLGMFFWVMIFWCGSCYFVVKKHKHYNL